jgi:hypothetical protein
VGRAIGATGAACATLLWGALLIAFLGLLIEPQGRFGWMLVIMMPFGVIAAMMFVVAVADLVVLVRRADRDLPWRVAGAHGLLAILGLWRGHVMLAIAPLLIAGTQLVALRLFQMMPSQPSSQR